MDHAEALLALGQASIDEAGEIMDQFIRGMTRQAVLDVMAEEVGQLCGTRYRHGIDRAYQRGGSAAGAIYAGAEKMPVERPRVRRQTASGAYKEVPLASYQAARAGRELKEAILRALECGVSARKQSRLYPDADRCSRSEISRQWEAAGRRRIDELRSRELEASGYVVLMLDGVVLCKGLCAIVALGITTDGRKQMLDFEIGASESSEVCKALCERLTDRGFKPAAKRLLLVLDGSDALRNAATATWKGCCIQRCLVHLERNVRGRLAHRWHGELAAHFKTLREAGSYEAANEAYDTLMTFAAKHTHAGLASLEAAREDALCLMRLGAGDTFSRTLLSTNAIENTIRNMRSLIARPARWRPETDMPDRWLAAAMLGAEYGFHRIRGYKQLGTLIKQLDQEEIGERGPHQF